MNFISLWLFLKTPEDGSNVSETWTPADTTTSTVQCSWHMLQFWVSINSAWLFLHKRVHRQTNKEHHSCLYVGKLKNHTFVEITLRSFTTAPLTNGYALNNRWGGSGIKCVLNVFNLTFKLYNLSLTVTITAWFKDFWENKNLYLQLLYQTRCHSVQAEWGTMIFFPAFIMKRPTN